MKDGINRWKNLIQRIHRKKELQNGKNFSDDKRFVNYMKNLTTDCDFLKLSPKSPITALQSYPAILIGRLGVSIDFSGQGIGSQLMEGVKIYCNSQFPHLARFLVVDAYNDDPVLSYYQRNKFSFVFSTEQQEKENLKKMVAGDESLRTRQMFYDMTQWRIES